MFAALKPALSQGLKLAGIGLSYAAGATLGYIAVKRVDMLVSDVAGSMKNKLDDKIRQRKFEKELKKEQMAQASAA